MLAYSASREGGRDRRRRQLTCRRVISSRREMRDGSSIFEKLRWVPSASRLPDGVGDGCSPTDAGIVVQFTDGSATFLPDWLRDNCQCNECRIVQTDERRWQPWSQPAAPVADVGRRRRWRAADRLGRWPPFHLRPGRVGRRSAPPPHEARGPPGCGMPATRSNGSTITSASPTR